MYDTNKIIDAGDNIRHIWDEKSKKCYFSIIDIISIVSESSDPRNYWKVLKSRLNKANPQLVTACNQLKMKGRDGKSYLTDTADSETVIDIIKSFSPEYIPPISTLLHKIESPYYKKDMEAIEDDADLMVDVYENAKSIVVESFIPGVSPSNISLFAKRDKLTIKGKRILPEELSGIDFYIKELYWGGFSRTINLSQEVDIDNIDATLSHGLLKIILPKADKDREKIIRIKN